MTGAGDAPWFSYDTYSLNDRLGAKVNLGTGNLVVSTADIAIPVVGGSRVLGRNFNSLALAPGSLSAPSPLFGPGWRFSEAPDRRLTPNADGSVTYLSASGHAAIFAANGLAAPAGVDATLLRNGDGTYKLTSHASGTVLNFRADGLMTSEVDRNANAITFTYPGGGGYEASIAGNAGTAPANTVNIAYGGPAGKVSALAQTFDGTTRTVSYTYDAADYLSEVTDAGGVTKFDYDPSTRNLVKITGPAPISQVTQFGYDTLRRVTSVTRVIPNDANAVTGYNYATPGHTKVTDPDNHPPLDYEFDSRARVTRLSDPKYPAADAALVFTYTDDNKVLTSRNGTGGTTTNDWSANAGDSLTSSTDPTGATAVASFANTGTLKWSPDWVSDTLGNKTAVGYNDSVADPRTVQNVTSSDWALTLYNPDGTVSSSTTPNNISTNILEVLLQDTSKSTRYGYFPTHQLQTITPPAVTPPPGGTAPGPQSFTYDGAGRLETATSGKGVVTTVTYDALDRTTNQAFTGGTPPIATGYDANGNVSSRTDALGTTSWLYDAANRLKTKTLAGGAVLGYTYDPAGNMLSSTDGVVG